MGTQNVVCVNFGPTSNEYLFTTTTTSTTNSFVTVAIAVLLFAGGHFENLSVTKVFLTPVNALEMETKGSKAITLHKHGLNAASNLGTGVGVMLQNVVYCIKLGAVQEGPTASKRCVGKSLGVLR